MLWKLGFLAGESTGDLRFFSERDFPRSRYTNKRMRVWFRLRLFKPTRWDFATGLQEWTNKQDMSDRKEKKKRLWRRLKKKAHCRFHTARGGQNKQDEAVRRHVVQKTPVMRLWNRDSRGKWELKQSNFHVVFSATLHDAVLQQLHEVQFDLQQKCAHEGRGKDMQSVGKHVNIDLFGTKDSLIDSINV